MRAVVWQGPHRMAIGEWPPPRLANGVHAARLALARPAVTGALAVIGAGAIGLLALQALRAASGSEVHLLEPDAGRRELALALGAHAGHATPEGLLAALRAGTAG